MAHHFAKVLEEEIEEASFYPSDLVNTKATTPPLRVGEERWIYTLTLRISVYIHPYSPHLRGIVICMALIRVTAFHIKPKHRGTHMIIIVSF